MDEATIVVDIASKCLQYEPKDRPTAKDLVATLLPLQTGLDVRNFFFSVPSLADPCQVF